MLSLSSFFTRQDRAGAPVSVSATGVNQLKMRMQGVLTSSNHDCDVTCITAPSRQHHNSGALTAGFGMKISQNKVRAGHYLITNFRSRGYTGNGALHKYASCKATCSDKTEALAKQCKTINFEIENGNLESFDHADVMCAHEFHSADTNNDGVLHQQEHAAAYHHTSHAALDINKDGELTLGEATGASETPIGQCMRWYDSHPPSSDPMICTTDASCIISVDPMAPPLSPAAIEYCHGPAGYAPRNKEQCREEPTMAAGCSWIPCDANCQDLSCQTVIDTSGSCVNFQGGPISHDCRSCAGISGEFVLGLCGYGEDMGPCDTTIPTEIKYRCRGDGCVQDLTGQLTKEDCNNKCSFQQECPESHPYAYTGEGEAPQLKCCKTIDESGNCILDAGQGNSVDCAFPAGAPTMLGCKDNAAALPQRTGTQVEFCDYGHYCSENVSCYSPYWEPTPGCGYTRHRWRSGKYWGDEPGFCPDSGTTGTPAGLMDRCEGQLGAQCYMDAVASGVDLYWHGTYPGPTTNTTCFG